MNGVNIKVKKCKMRSLGVADTSDLHVATIDTAHNNATEVKLYSVPCGCVKTHLFFPRSYRQS